MCEIKERAGREREVEREDGSEREGGRVRERENC